jgi:L-lactate dehydrogenase (cytochrome)
MAELARMIAVSTADFRAAAQRRLPRFLFDYIDGGAGDELTLRRNAADLAAICLQQRVLRDVSEVRLDSLLFGQRCALPVALGPVGLTGMYARRGEALAARAAAKAGIPFCMSTVSICSAAEVAQASGVAPWFQLYVLRDRGFARELLKHVQELGSRVLVFTVDMPVPGVRRRDAHSGMSGPYAALRRYWQAFNRPRWAWDVGIRGRPHVLGSVAPVLKDATGLEDFMGWLANNFDPSIRWADLEWIRAAWPGPLIVKGIMSVDDARSAASMGADGIVVSNHGGRQLDGAMSTAQVLPAIAAAVGDRLTVLADSGIRSGLDVVRMLALGARGVLLGRAWVYALAASGEAGVARLLDLFAEELRVTMTLAGARTIAEVDASILATQAPCSS